MPQPSQRPPEDPQPFTAPAPGLHPRQRAWVEVDEGAIERNARALSRWLAPGSSLMAVVKADGYGHGAAPVARAALDGGATSLGVATLQEGIELRQAGLEVPLLVMGNLINPDELRSCLDWELMPTISGMREALLCQNLASGSGRSMALQLKVDTGMARLGVDWSDGVRLLKALHELDAVNVAGVYSHLADADAPHQDPDGLTGLQQDRFEKVLRGAGELGLTTGSRHLANSAGTLSSHRLHYDLVRVGLALYGQSPAPHLSARVPLQPAMSVRARVCLIREVPAGVGVSYGHQYRTRRASRLAVVTIGYADGVPRLLSNRLEVLFAGRRLTQVGAITMDQLLIDATDAPQLEVGSVVTLLGEDGGERIGPQEWAQASGTIPWEILCGFKHRLPRLRTDEAERDR
ncbi:alanine racemase [Synechococcus sp. CS-205]|uniref:alanine racemase n=1 Tax=Synechococcus sp. CS-205 TaxID=2847984 RepID=UPI00223A9E12|nr:alanine racemase [Synechococcus sp. CS-205]MCT0247965.1 alanine racemase [Synechococcus sp. CS-205]